MSESMYASWNMGVWSVGRGLGGGITLPVLAVPAVPPTPPPPPPPLAGAGADVDADAGLGGGDMVAVAWNRVRET